VSNRRHYKFKDWPNGRKNGAFVLTPTVRQSTRTQSCID
uniref:Uncharacterized protein n=1 Tax=Anopheles minimus TaxID=112268 RepID=A0A182WPN0_9DIPT